MKSYFRVSRAGGPVENVVRTLGQTIVFWTVFLWIIPAGLVRIEARLGLPYFDFSGGQTTAVIGFAAASALGLWSGLTMAVAGRGTPLPTAAASRLVLSGPYAWVRNPMAVAGLSQGAFVGLYRGSWLTLAYVAAGFFLWNWLVRPVEEADLLQRFGDSYREYCGRVRCWIPTLRLRAPRRRTPSSESRGGGSRGPGR